MERSLQWNHTLKRHGMSRYNSSSTHTDTDNKDFVSYTHIQLSHSWSVVTAMKGLASSLPSLRVMKSTCREVVALPTSSKSASCK